MAATLIGQVEVFQPGTDDWEQYVERLEQYFVANDIAEGRRRATFLTVIGSKTYALLSDLLAPDKPATKTYPELVATLKAHFKPKRIDIAERYRFRQRKRKDGEGVTAYLAALRGLAENCEFGAHREEALRDQFVHGIRREATLKKLLSMDGLTLKTAFETAYGMEIAEQQTSELCAGPELPLEAGAVRVVKPIQPQQFTKVSKSACYRCGKVNHSPENCFFRKQKCRVCGKLGHIARVCKSVKRSQPGTTTHFVEQEGSTQTANSSDVDEHEDLTLLNIQQVRSNQGIKLEVVVDDRLLQMELDTGASVSIISEKLWKDLFQSPSLTISKIKLAMYTGHRLRILGEWIVRVKYGVQEQELPLIVVAGEGPALFGRNWLSQIRLDWSTIHTLQTPLQQLLDKYSEVFRPELGTLKNIRAKLEIMPDACPRFHKPRPVPYALNESIEKDLERLEGEGVIEKVSYSDWAAPIVPVPKSGGGVRICGDYRVTINPALEVHQYPMPTPEDLFSTMAGGQTFSKLDLTSAYQQVQLEPQSFQYVTVNTHKGLYQYKRLPFGVASAPAIFQEIMEKLLQGIPGVVVYIDDIAITGKTKDEHLQHLEAVLDRLQKAGLRLKLPKCRFMLKSIKYLGYLIDKDGLHALPEKVEAIMQAPNPRNVQELRAFLGLVNYYGKFIPNLSTLVFPLSQLLCKGAVWKWDDNCIQAFTTLKNTLASAEVLAHYDSSLPLKLDCDASAYGIGAVLSHTYHDGSERPIAYASRTLTGAERNYAQIEREGVSIVFGVRKFHKYLFGRRFTLVTDHKPLVSIFGPKKNLPTLAAARMQRWAVLLLGYQYDLKFRTSNQHSNADGFSRLPRADVSVKEDALEMGTVTFNVHQISSLPVTANQIRTATVRDPILSTVMRYTKGGWPEIVSRELQPYRQRQTELSIELDCLFWGTRIVVPSSLRKEVLAELHTSHQGIVRMKGRVRAYVWWPNLSADIEKTVFDCEACQANRSQPQLVPLQQWPWPQEPWERVHLDFAGPLFDHMYLVAVDSHSKWLEVIPMKSTTTEKTLGVLRSLFARHGLPHHVVSDNGPQFTAKEFETFMLVNGIKHSRSPPYHPATNGEAERFVQIFKRSLKVGKGDEGTMTQKLSQFLLTYRSTPHMTTGVSPAELFLKRKLRTRLDLLRPTVKDQVQDKMKEQNESHDKKSHYRSFQVGQAVLVRNVRPGSPWLVGEIHQKLSPVTYEVNVGGQTWRRHVDQLLEFKGSQRLESEQQTQPQDDHSDLGSDPSLPVVPFSIATDVVAETPVAPTSLSEPAVAQSLRNSPSQNSTDTNLPIDPASPVSLSNSQKRNNPATPLNRNPED